MNAPLHFPSFFNLRQFAQDAHPSGPEPGGVVRHHVQFPSGPITVGALYIAPGDYVEPTDGDEFVFVHQGQVSLHAGGVELSLAPGDSAVIREGTVVRWIAADTATLIFMRYRTKSAESASPVPINYAAELLPSGAPLAELLTTPTPACRNFTDYRSIDGEFLCGTWDSTPYARKAMRYRHHELMYLLDGEVSFEDQFGTRATFVTGDVFLVRQGAECSWDSKVHVRKVYAIWRPA